MLHVVFQTVTVFVGEPLPSCLQIYGGTEQKNRLLLRSRIIRPQGRYIFSGAGLGRRLIVEQFRNLLYQFLGHGVVLYVVWVIACKIFGLNVNPVISGAADDIQAIFVCGQKQIGTVCGSVVPLCPLVYIANDRAVRIEIISVYIDIGCQSAFIPGEGIPNFCLERTFREKISGHSIGIN